jgi:hypothetical protein
VTLVLQDKNINLSKKSNIEYHQKGKLFFLEPLAPWFMLLASYHDFAHVSTIPFS